MTDYDIIGDIHGHAGELRELLSRLGYRRSGHGYYHPERQVIFVGDFIDRGPAIAETIQIARATVDDGNGLAVMGNHEFNAIAFHTRRPDGREFFRERDDKNQHQHQATLDQLSSLELSDAIEWFKTLPVALDLEDLRVVHAAWQPTDIEVLETGLRDLERFTPDFLLQACDTNSRLFQAVENVLKGPEIALPVGTSFKDKDGHKREKTRVRWYADPVEMTLRDFAIGAGDGLPAVPVPQDRLNGITPYAAAEPPVFFGHYWLQGTPAPFAKNVACVDYSVAKQGKLCAYRWDAGDTEASQDRFEWVAAKS